MRDGVAASSVGRPAGLHLQGPLDHVVPANEGVQPPLCGIQRQVAPVPLEHGAADHRPAQGDGALGATHGSGAALKQGHWSGHRLSRITPRLVACDRRACRTRLAGQRGLGPRCAAGRRQRRGRRTSARPPLAVACPPGLGARRASASFVCPSPRAMGANPLEARPLAARYHAAPLILARSTA